MKKIKIALIVLVIVEVVICLYFLARWWVEKRYLPSEVRQSYTEVQQLQEEAREFSGNEK